MPGDTTKTPRVKFLTDERDQVHLISNRAAPAAAQHYIIAEAAVEYTLADFGAIISQEIRGQDFSICDYRFFISRQVTLFPYTALPLLTLVYVLQGTLACELAGQGAVLLKEDFYYLFYVPPRIRHQAYFPPGDYHVFHINLSAVYLNHLQDNYPGLKELLDRLRLHSPDGRKEIEIPLSFGARLVIDQVLQSKESESERDMFMQARIRDLLLLYMKDMRKPDHKPVRNREELYQQKLILAKHILDTHRGRPLTIAALSRKILLNDFKLKTGFRKKFGKSVLGYQVALRMDAARQLLLSSKRPVEHIAAQLGYEDKSSFIKKFKKHFGATPLQFRKQNQK